MGDELQKPGSDALKIAIDLARYELDYRRKKQWDIFAWTVTILVAVIGGVVALASKEELKKLHMPQRWIAAFALLVLAIYACRWIAQNIYLEERARKSLEKLLRQGGVVPDSIREPERQPRFGYAMVVALVAMAAIATILGVDGPWMNW